jgi:hypothetical protein
MGGAIVPDENFKPGGSVSGCERLITAEQMKALES